MNITRYPDNPEQLLQRPGLDRRELHTTVRDIMAEVQSQGDDALRAYSRQFDQVELSDIRLKVADLDATIAPELAEAIEVAHRNIRAFHMLQGQAPVRVKTMPGVTCWRKSLPIQSVGLYVPGGTAPLFSSLLMLGVPAVLAGCPEIVVATPPQPDGSVHPAIVYIAQLLRLEYLYPIGGAQAIAAMTHGTESVPRVQKLFGPGNQYVTAAKQLAQQQGVAIDMPAGPSEVLVVADETADPSFVAADLLSQAEHGRDSQVVLLTDSEPLLTAVQSAIATQLQALPRRHIARTALDNSHLLLVQDLEEAMRISNRYAPEHLILNTRNAAQLAESVTQAGSVFIGAYSPESVGDYASGTNHTLPTNGYAGAYSGVSYDSFVKQVTFQELTREGLANIAPTVMTLADAEGLAAHGEAVRVRIVNCEL